ncbi:MAG TPA: hypothetical protein VFV83_06855, partial [Chthoniobacteraceae bacterium]|nr:hypothetical protein [Chthoniobacteraceae bacterium]
GKMNDFEVSDRRHRLSVAEAVGLLILFCTPALIGMARHPFWIDETLTLLPVPVKSNSLTDLLREFLHFPGSIRYTPLYVLLVAVWARMVPPVELAIRCINIPFLLGSALVSHAFVARLPIRSPGQKWLALALIATSPFFVYYSFDLRPYASLIFFGGLIVLGLIQCDEMNRSGPWLISLGFCLAFITQPPVVVLAPVIFICVLLLARKNLSASIRMWAAPGIVGILLTAAAAIYYYIVRSGGGMEPWGGGGFSKNVLFICYEFAGFAGLGPTRAQLRTLAPPAGREATVASVSLSWPDWIPAVLFGVVWAVIAIQLIRLVLARGNLRLWLTPCVRWNAMIFTGGLVVLSLFFYLMQHRFLSRHISFLYLPFIFTLLALFAQTGWDRWNRWAVPLLLIGFSVSSGQLLFNRGHMREDPKRMIAAWEAARAKDATVRLWAFYPVQSVVYYTNEGRVPSLRADTMSICQRVGSVSYAETRPSTLDPEVCRNARVISLDSPGRNLWQQLLDSCRGQRVILAFNRGTEFDHDDLGRELLADPRAQSAKVAEGAFVECFECTIP